MRTKNPQFMQLIRALRSGSWGASCYRRSLSLTLLEAALEQDLDPGEAQQDAEGRVVGVVSVRRGKLVFEQGLDAGQAEMEVVQIVFVRRQAAAGPGGCTLRENDEGGGNAAEIVLAAPRRCCPLCSPPVRG